MMAPAVVVVVAARILNEKLLKQSIFCMYAIVFFFVLLKCKQMYTWWCWCWCGWRCQLIFGTLGWRKIDFKLTTKTLDIQCTSSISHHSRTKRVKLHNSKWKMVGRKNWRLVLYCCRHHRRRHRQHHCRCRLNASGTWCFIYLYEKWVEF